MISGPIVSSRRQRRRGRGRGRSARRRVDSNSRSAASVLERAAGAAQRGTRVSRRGVFHAARRNCAQHSRRSAAAGSFFVAGVAGFAGGVTAGFAAGVAAGLPLACRGRVAAAARGTLAPLQRDVGPTSSWGASIPMTWRSDARPLQARATTRSRIGEATLTAAWKNSWTSLTSRCPFRNRSADRPFTATLRHTARCQQSQASSNPPFRRSPLKFTAFATVRRPCRPGLNITVSFLGPRGNLRARARPPAQSPRRSLPAALLNGPDLRACAEVAQAPGDASIRAEIGYAGPRRRKWSSR